jgi:hypothetical protein
MRAIVATQSLGNLRNLQILGDLQRHLSLQNGRASEPPWSWDSVCRPHVSSVSVYTESLSNLGQTLRCCQKIKLLFPPHHNTHAAE